MAAPGAFEAIVAEVGRFLLPLRRSLASPEAFKSLLLQLGWSADDIPQPLGDLAADLELLIERVRKLVGDGLSFDGTIVGIGPTAVAIEDAARVIEAITNVVEGIEAIANAPDSAFPPALVVDGFKAKFPKQLVGYLFDQYLRTHRPGIGFALQAFGVTKAHYQPASGNRPPYVEYEVGFADIPKVFDDPEVLLENAFGWGTDAFDYPLLQAKIDDLASALGLHVVFDDVDPATAHLLEGASAPFDPGRRQKLRIVLFDQVLNTARVSADVAMYPLPKAGALKPGFAIMPRFVGTLSEKLQFAPNLALTVASDLDAQGGIALMVRPDVGIDMVLGFDKPGTPVTAKGSLRLDLEYARADRTPTPLLGESDGTRLEIVSASGTGGFLLTGGDQVEPFVELDTDGLALVIDPSKSDGFVSKILSGVSARVEFDLAAGFAHPRGFYFRGTSNLEIQLPLHINLGPVEIQAMTIAVRPSGAAMPIDLGATLKAKLGPLTAVVEDLGLTADLAFPGQGGNLGPINLEFRFKPPKGAGLSIDAGAVSGGGYLYIDRDRGEYAGALELRILDLLNVSAIGLITTRMPDGSKDFAFLGVISVEFNPGLQLGFGFTLLGVGGLVGLNRAMDLDALGAGARSGALDSVLFPTDVVANAPRILSDLNTFFPLERGTFLIGPMMKLGWGTPTLISLSLGVIIEIPGNVAIVGKLTIAIPDEDAALVVIKVAFIGAIEFDRKRGWFYATLYESRIVFMPLDGSVGVLAAFAEDANFVVSVGGFHPAYKPPPLPFPALARIAINILHTPLARIRIDAYFAVTSNTLQFGARAEVYFGISIASIEGHLAFDALFQRSPFYFKVTISASLSVKLFGTGVFSVRFRGILEGTSPWHVEGSGSISLLFWDVDVDFSHSWGEGAETRLPPIPVLPLLTAELAKAENWTARLEDADALHVSLGSIDAADGVVLHPLGTLRISQRAIPLGIPLDRVGSQRPADADLFAVAATTAGLETRGALRESFAIAQFQDLEDSEKLAAADFEQEESGVELAVSGSQARSGYVTKRIARYEQIVIDNNFKRAALRLVTLVSGLFTHLLANNTVARSELSARTRDLKNLLGPKIEVQPNAYVVVSQVDNSPLGGDVLSFASHASAKAFLAAEAARNPSFGEQAHIVRAHEMKLAA